MVQKWSSQPRYVNIKDQTKLDTIYHFFLPLCFSKTMYWIHFNNMGLNCHPKDIPTLICVVPNRLFMSSPWGISKPMWSPKIQTSTFVIKIPLEVTHCCRTFCTLKRDLYFQGDDLKTRSSWICHSQGPPPSLSFLPFKFLVYGERRFCFRGRYWCRCTKRQPPSLYTSLWWSNIGIFVGPVQACMFWIE